ncbi:hypothetical protein LEMLEM_LOCUS17936 [Lemmus lemmus]
MILLRMLVLNRPLLSPAEPRWRILSAFPKLPSTHPYPSQCFLLYHPPTQPQLSPHCWDAC